MTTSNSVILKRDLCRISKDKQLAFILLLCCRMMPALRQFSVETSFSDSLYEGCLDIAWRCLEKTSNFTNYGEVSDECLHDAPDTEEYDHPLTSAALNAALSVAEMMRFLADFDVGHVMEASSLACDTAALSAQSIEATPPRSLGFTEVMDHALVQQELQRQADDLRFLESLPTDIYPNLIALIKERAMHKV